MKVTLLQPGCPTPSLGRPRRWRALIDDLGLNTVYAAMAAGDSFIHNVVAETVPAGLTDIGHIIHRQRVLADCLDNRAAVRELYDIVTEAVEGRSCRSYAGLLIREPEAIVHRSVERLEFLMADLRRVRKLAETEGHRFHSDGFTVLFAALVEQLDDNYFAHVDDCLAELRFPRGTYYSAQLGTGNRARGFMLHRPGRYTWRDWFTSDPGTGVGFEIPADDGMRSRELTGLAAHGSNAVAAMMSDAAEQVQGFFTRLRAELGFYLGCLNLWDRLTAAGVAVCFPTPLPIRPQAWHVRDLRDVGLCLLTDEFVVGNDIDAPDGSLIMVTGENAGGKSTFLRGVGTAQIMMQAGMFVTAAEFAANLRDGVYTHFTQEKDTGMAHGRLDEELVRCSEIVDEISATPDRQALVLCNEPFFCTDEREGSFIADQVVRALTEAGVKLVYVTHLYQTAHQRFVEHHLGDVFLRAECRADGARSYRLVPAPPIPAGFARDSLRHIFRPERHPGWFTRGDTRR